MGGIGVANAIAIASEPLPKFSEGEINITGLKHSQGGVNAEIEGGESVISAKGTEGSTKLLTAINEGRIKDADILMPGSSKIFSGADTPELAKKHSSVINLEPLIKEQQLTRQAISNQPKNITNLTDAGISKVYESNTNKKKWLNDWIKK